MACAPRLFFVYAYPCSEVLVNRGTIGKKELGVLRRKLLKGECRGLDPLMFEKGFERLKAFAKKKRSGITPSVVSEYFLTQHNGVVLRVAKRKKDVKPEMCFVSPGLVLDAKAGKAKALTPFGCRSINIGFVPKIKSGDLVSVHYNYACEKIPLDDFKRLWKEVCDYGRKN